MMRQAASSAAAFARRGAGPANGRLRRTFHSSSSVPATRSAAGAGAGAVRRRPLPSSASASTPSSVATAHRLPPTAAAASASTTTGSTISAFSAQSSTFRRAPSPPSWKVRGDVGGATSGGSMRIRGGGLAVGPPRGMPPARFLSSSSGGSGGVDKKAGTDSLTTTSEGGKKDAADGGEIASREGKTREKREAAEKSSGSASTASATTGGAPKETVAADSKAEDAAEAAASEALAARTFEGAAAAGTVTAVRSRIRTVVESVGERLPSYSPPALPEHWHPSDLLSVVGVIAIVGLVLAGPMFAEKMKASDSKYDEVQISEAIKNVMVEVTRDLQEAEGVDVDGAVGGVKKVGAGLTAEVVANVINSEVVQAAVLNLATKVVSSPQFQEACQDLVQKLWKDLISDPETMDQLVRIFRDVLTNDSTRDAARELVIALVRDEEVYRELMDMVVRLGDEKEVLGATQALLTESAHKALNDPEILDHSMEFATDVVGDDVVQRTSGEALRNTVGYAVMPGWYTVLTMAGVALVLFSFSALTNARSSGTAGGTGFNANDRALDAALDRGAAPGELERALLAEGGTNALGRVLALPGHVASCAASAVVRAIKFPFVLAGGMIRSAGRAGRSVVSGTAGMLTALTSLPGAAMRGAGRAGINISVRARDAWGASSAGMALARAWDGTRRGAAGAAVALSPSRIKSGIGVLVRPVTMTFRRMGMATKFVQARAVALVARAGIVASDARGSATRLLAHSDDAARTVLATLGSLGAATSRSLSGVRRYTTSTLGGLGAAVTYSRARLGQLSAAAGGAAAGSFGLSSASNRIRAVLSGVVLKLQEAIRRRTVKNE